ncbi:MAG: tetratricopeptide repeat protein [Ignavibacteriae bacterium]|nr:tetratricopeptide repeat protein [Ignavibacteriota bacterium]MCB9206953.1 tetratricopeptide repeat protein [Ignavibacteriales bacterium]MCB9210463.1 tetratricopeptide repeat protein [Ignavibacteriales bacterium]MCB9219726.1 tetratricopeptide repeat protein [Ignavibacteriales bacterium]
MSKQKSNKISVFQLSSIIIVLLFIGGFILITSGIFDTHEVAANQHNHTNNNTNMGSSVDLNKINEINRLEEIVKNNPDNHEALLNLGHLLNDNGFFERAVEKYQTYLKTHADNADVIVDLGVCYFEMKNYEKSIDVIKSALKVNPKHQIAHFNLGIVNLANGNMAEAEQWWQKARDIDPNTNIGKKAEELLKSHN